MRINNAQRVAAAVLTALLLTGAGQVAASASDPQWEAHPQWSDSRWTDPQWESAPPTTQP
ncbi:hypothetical protein [Promicromonospora sp. MEB111]|uniref:hypothetical protein n=1 Tax=unclassified Promicromonospora TaxID=2647929 RepID=UPI002550E419|nr:hypothetical protein [Promicromonospora sp. MEB111]